MAGLPARVKDTGSRAGTAGKMPRERDRNLTEAETALNETDPQENDKIQRQAVPLDVVGSGSGSARRSLQDANISRMRAQFQVDLEAARSDFENQLAGVYQRKLDDAERQLRTTQQHQDKATLSCREMSQQLAAVQKTNREQQDELSRVRNEYDKYKQQTEQQTMEMAKMLHDTNVRYQQVVEEKQQLAELYAGFSAGIKAYDALKKGDKERVGNATPECLTDQNARVPKRKRPEVSSSRLTASASRVSSVARSPSPHAQPQRSRSGTARTASTSRSRISDKIRLMQRKTGQDVGTEHTDDETPGLYGSDSFSAPCPDYSPEPPRYDANGAGLSSYNSYIQSPGMAYTPGPSSHNPDYESRMSNPPGTPDGGVDLEHTDWVTTDIQVRIKRHDDGSLVNMIGYVRSTAGTMCSVFLPDNDKVIGIKAANLKPITPYRGDMVKVILGDERGMYGKMLSVECRDAVFKPENSGQDSMKVVPWQYLCRLAPAIRY